MCGIAGYFLTKPMTLASTLMAMSSSIRHRGPDDEGFVFVSISNKKYQTYSSRISPSEVVANWPQLVPDSAVLPHEVALSQVRYSIIDLGPAGHQPMWSTCGNACLTFNGEIYNYIELRAELTLLGYAFKTQSDTEVFLTGYLAWGEEVFTKLNGFFAVAIYDARNKSILLARDRLGKANFYLHRDPSGGIYWASEIKALRAARCIDDEEINTSALADYLIYGYRDRGVTFWREVEDFPPGHYIRIDKSRDWNPVCYWQLPKKRWETNDITAEESYSGLADLLTESLQLRLRADVPVAFELSGGMDSSALVGLAAGRLGAKFTTCTIEFPQAHSNEEPYARLVANRYSDQIDYRVIQPPVDEFWNEADTFVWLQEEPFHAPNLHTNQVLRRVFKESGIDVVITGAAGDEMLAGYAGDYLGPYLRHLLMKGKLKEFSHEIYANSEIPLFRGLVGLILDKILPEKQRALFGSWRRGEYRLLAKVLLPGVLDAPLPLLSEMAGNSFHDRTVNNMTHRRMNYWLRSGSKSNYGIPIETRAPFLDYRVVEYCCQLPPEYLIHDGWHKFVLRKAVEQYLPDEVTWRRNKMGFPFPYREWLTASKAVFFKNSQGIDCPYIDNKTLFQYYDEFVQVAPVTLWRLISVVLWWRRVIEGREIYAS